MIKDQLFSILRLLGLIGLAIAAPNLCEAQSYTITTVAGGAPCCANGDGGPATKAYLGTLASLATDASGNLYLGCAVCAGSFDSAGIREVDTQGTITTVVSEGFLGAPSPIALDAAGDIYCFNAEELTEVVSGKSTNIAFSLFGSTGLAIDGLGDIFYTNGLGVSKIDSKGITSTVNYGSEEIPFGLAVDSRGNLYVTAGTGQAFKVDTAGNSTLLAGTGVAGYSGDGGPAIHAQLNFPKGIAVDSAGNVYISDTMNNRIRKIDTTGAISTIAGTGGILLSGDGGPATSAGVDAPGDIAVTRSGVIYVADTMHNVVRALTPTGTGSSGSSPTIESGGVVSASAFGQFSAVAPGSWIEIYGTNLAADSRSWSQSDFSGLTAPTQLDGTTVTIGGQHAYIDYISPTQVNAQVPSNAPSGSQPVVVNSAAGERVRHS